LAQAGADLAAFVAQVDLEDEELVGVWMRFAFENRRDAEVEFGEVVVLDRGGCGGSGRRRCWVGGCFHFCFPFEDFIRGNTASKLAGYTNALVVRRFPGFFLEEEGGGSDEDLVAMAEALAGNWFAVDVRGCAEWEVFDFDAAALKEVDGGVASADFGIAEEIDLAIGSRADVRGVAVEDELFSGDESCGDFEPAGAGGAFEESRGGAGDGADADHGGEGCEFGAVGDVGEGFEKESADCAADRAASETDEEPLAIFHDDAGRDGKE
jgi:hypothetical protein